MGIIGYMWQGKVKKKEGKKTKDVYVPKMLVGPHEKYKTKDRTGLLGSVMVSPTMDQVIEANNQTEDE